MMKKEQKDNIPKIKYYTDFIGKLHFSSEEKAAIAKKVTAIHQKKKLLSLKR